ncbi:MAG: glycosyltransferase family 4 protein [Candidatus Hydrogenedentes bacterium]|nr:glycosyltransferase family 4 protein [Candidatus Hydrogenedentota bacterium]
MRIGIDVGPVTQRPTGVGNYCRNLFSTLVEECRDDSFVAFSASMHPPALGSAGPRVTMRHFPAPTRALYGLWSTVGLPRIEAMTGPVDVYHATNFFLPPARTCGRVLTIHDLGFLVVPEMCSPKIVGPFSKRMRRFAAEADVVLADSEATRQDILRLLEVPPAKVVAAPLAAGKDLRPMDRDEARRVVRERHGLHEPYLLFVSTLEPRKNVTGLLRVFARLRDRIPHRLVLVGATGWNADPIVEAIATLGISDRVVRLGFAPGNDLNALYSAADVFVFPSYYEGFGLPVLEAMTCGCPVVTSNRSSLPEVVGEAGTMCEPDDHAAIAEAVMRLIEDGAARERAVARGLAQAATFSWSACAAITREAYERAASCVS